MAIFRKGITGVEVPFSSVLLACIAEWPLFNDFPHCGLVGSDPK